MNKVHSMSKPFFAVMVATAVLIGAAAPSYADTVLAGFDYFHTLDDASSNFDFSNTPLGGFGVGVVDFIGDPFGPFNADTIVERLQDANLPFLGSLDTIDIEMVALSLVSANPIDIGGFGYLIHITEDPILASGGTMTIRHELFFSDDLANKPEGTYDSFFNLFLDISFTPLDGGPAIPQFDLDNIDFASTNTFWTHTHDLVPALPGATNFLLADFNDPSFPLGLVEEIHPDPLGMGLHRAENIMIPAPGSLALLGLAGLFARRRRR